MRKNKLYEQINVEKKSFKKKQPEALKIPAYILNNLKHSFFPWQSEALENLFYYENPWSQLKTQPTYLLFHMATGSGKTLVMAATILYYYKRGYRYFLFFVNRNNIIDKTENNFVNRTHRKYLFTPKIFIDNQGILIKKVETFSVNPIGIEIKITSIQKLHNDIHVTKENQTTLDDLHNKDIVMLADEAHHLNTNTKEEYNESLKLNQVLTGKTSKQNLEKKGWEHTVVNLILKKNGSKRKNRNILLEFTATLPTHQNIIKKYGDKILYKFELKDFLQAGYTKEINLLSSKLSKKERILHALIFQWYRHHIALKYQIPSFKPVILFRSRTIADSQQDYKEFIDWINIIDSFSFAFLHHIIDQIGKEEKAFLFNIGEFRTKQILQFIKNEDISYHQIAKWLKKNFTMTNTLITNSHADIYNLKMNKEKTTAYQDKLLNSLEDANNHIRAIFTVDRLTEGWDVLNLFDIVLLYKRYNIRNNTLQIREATVKEKQLIGRGVRYYPFNHAGIIPSKRKFDKDLNHELRILEELCYHTYDEESRYISHLKEELKQEGYISTNKIYKTFSLKTEFQKSVFYKNISIWYNKQMENYGEEGKTLQDFKIHFSLPPYKCGTSDLQEEQISLHKPEPVVYPQHQIISSQVHNISLLFREVDRHIFRKALHKQANRNPFFCFENLSKKLHITSMDDLQHNEFLGDCCISILTNVPTYDDLSAKDKLHSIMYFLDYFGTEFDSLIKGKTGSTEFYPTTLDSIFGMPKTKILDAHYETNHEQDDMVIRHTWYALDSFSNTQEEKYLVECMKKNFSRLEKKYDQIYLIRNEDIYKIYDFERGRGFYPTFLLFLRRKKTSIYYQIFIELQSNTLFNHQREQWKRKFLHSIRQKYQLNTQYMSSIQYRLVGYLYII